MKVIIPLLLTLFFSCSDYDGGDLSLLQEMQGEWQNTQNQRHYLFADDYATTWDYNFSTVINAKWYKVRQVGERDLSLVEVNTKDTLLWRFSQVDSIVTVADVTNAATVYFDLKRK